MTRIVLSLFIVVILTGGAVLLLRKKSKEVGESPLASATLSATANPLEANIGQVVKLDNGLQLQDLVVGTGAEAKTGYAISANYLGTLENGTKFDSSYDRGQAFSFILGAGQVIKGWDIGIQGMKVGGKRKLIIPPDLGYGPQANGPIPANSTLIFEVELMAVQEVK